MKITYYVHGTTTDNENGIATGWNEGKLSELGIKQSKELAEVVALEEFDAVFCSDLKRAVDSARLNFPDQEIVQDQRLRECNYGDYNGKPHDFKDSLTDYIKGPFPSGESYHEVEKRMREFLDKVKQEYGDKHIAIVAHQAPQLALEVIANNKSWEEAMATDWRISGAWKPGWEYSY